MNEFAISKHIGTLSETLIAIVTLDTIEKLSSYLTTQNFMQKIK
jgi:hypothetical protein